ncbi:MAG: RnfH family protein [Endozoicomonadaceae bacterium]|nr:RnfH family protein [Endozoicomonadaceae bacterium]
MTIEVEIIYATTECVSRCTFLVPLGTTAYDIVELSEFKKLHKNTLKNELTIGVYGKKIIQPDAYLVQAGDRIELYRSTTRDVKKKQLK